MVSRLFLIYAVVELAVIIALVSTIGLGWTVLVLLATFVVGLSVGLAQFGRQLARQLMLLRSGLATPREALSDSALVTLGTVLVVIPGLVTTAAGLLLLVPATRAVAGPAVTTVVLRGLGVQAPITDMLSRADFRRRGHSGDGRDFIDGEVIDVMDVRDVADVEPPALPGGPIAGQPGRPASSPGGI
jgi:UPF0716 protein FxsA